MHIIIKVTKWFTNQFGCTLCCLPNNSVKQEVGEFMVHERCQSLHKRPWPIKEVRVHMGKVVVQ